MERQPSDLWGVPVQMRCSNCFTAMAVPKHAGSFPCPSCGALSVLQAPVQAPVRPAKISRSRPEFVVVALFIVGSVAAFFAGPLGIAGGVVLLGWSVLSCFGKLPSPVGTLLPNGARSNALRIASFLLGAVGILSGALGMELSSDPQSEQAALRAEALAIVPSYAAELDRIEALIEAGKSDRGKLDEAQRALSEAAEITEPYTRRAASVPDELAELEARRVELKGRAEEAGRQLERVKRSVPTTCPTVHRTVGPTCTKGKRCGNSCIAQDKRCHL